MVLTQVHPHYQAGHELLLLTATASRHRSSNWMASLWQLVKMTWPLISRRRNRTLQEHW
jgi:hypothetical protein